MVKPIIERGDKSELSGKLKEKCEFICESFASEDDEDFVKCAQEINDYLVNTAIKVGSTIIEPLWLETYFDTKDGKESNSHRNAIQQNRFGLLYFHTMGRGGVDIVLSTNEKYFSVLIKAARINGQVYSQIYVKSVLRGLGIVDDCRFSVEDKDGGDIIAEHLPRVNVKFRKTLNLASCLLDGYRRGGQTSENAYRCLVRRHKANGRCH